MVRKIIVYGDSILREKGKRVEEVTDKIRQLAHDMVETMNEVSGIGLAAQQVGISIQLAVVDVSYDPNCITYLKVNGEECSLEEIMPLVFINPEIEPHGERESGAEGCLSFPGLQFDIRRPKEIKAKLELLDGRILEIETDGLLARAIQHEVDHLHGILFIDRISAAAKISLKRKLREMQEQLV